MISLMTDDELFAQFQHDFTALALDPGEVILTMTKVEAWGLLSQIQLALRHPQNTGEIASVARSIGEMIQREVATTPALQEVANRGWGKIVTTSQPPD